MNGRFHLELNYFCRMRKGIVEILPGIGLGVIKFGMDRNQVKMILSEPDEKDVFFMTESDDSEAEVWYYDEDFLSLSFDAADDWRLVTIEVDHEKYTLNGVSFFNKNKLETIRALEEINVLDFKHEPVPMDEAPDHELVSSESLGINFWFDEDQVTEIQWGPFFNADESVKWPEK